MNIGPAVNQADVLAAIVSETYTVLPNGRTTVCQLTLDNGYTVEGMSACVSHENFDADMGKLLAHGKAFEQVWPLLGFRLADQIQRDKVFESPKVDPFVSLGDQVWYYERLEDQESEKMVAFVSHIEDGYRVHLTVLAPNGTAHARNDVTVLGDNEESPAGMSYYARRKN